HYMRAMTMPFEVRNEPDLDTVVPGALIEFVLVVDRATSYAERLRVIRYQSVEPDPFSASRLTLLREIVGGTPARTLDNGATVPDFTLTDQENRPFILSKTRGKVVAINFIYTRCALPNFCLRLANNFNVVPRRCSRLSRLCYRYRVAVASRRRLEQQRHAMHRFRGRHKSFCRI